MAGIASKPDQLIHLLAGAQLLAAGEKADGDQWEIGDQLLDYRNGRVVVVGYVKENLKFRVVLARKAGEILVGVAVKAADRLQDADGRGEIASGSGRCRTAEKTQRGDGRA